MEARTGGRRREAAWLGGLIALVGLGLWLGLGSGRKANDRATPAVDEGATATAEPGPEPAPAAPLDTSAQRLPSEVAARPDRDLVLILERYPDGAPVAWTPVRVEPKGAGDLGAGLPNGDDWLASSGEGRVTVRVPGSASAVRVEARGYEIREVPLGFYALERRLALTPTEGLFGRVLREDGEPAEGAEVRAVTTRWTAQVQFDSRLPKPQVHTSGLTRVIAGASANAEGFYCLACPTANPGAPVTVEARLGTSVATQEVALPRAPAALPDLVLEPPREVLRMRVVDTQGNPIPDALVRSGGQPLPPGRDRTDARGELAILAPALPEAFFASAPGHYPRAIRFDGEEVPFWKPVESAATRVEIELEALPCARIRLVDEETRLPVFLGHGRVVLWAGGAAIGGSEFEPDRQGEAWVFFVDAEGQDGPPAELARITFDKDGYDPEQVFELDARAPPGPEPIELALRPLADFGLLRGRVVRGDEPVPGFQVGLKAQAGGPGDSRPSYQYNRAYTDAEGRFTLRWRRLGNPLSITVHPHWTQWDEFGFVGPMSEEEAMAGEHVLALTPAVHVPARLHGTVRGASYLYFVSLVEGENVVSTTINGVPIPGAADGEVRTVMRLPAGRRVRVSIGHSAEGALYTNDCPPVELDTARPPALLEFELSTPFLRVRGQVPGVDPTAYGIALLATSSRESGRSTNLTLLEPDGSFERMAPPGEYELCLIGLATGPWEASLQARRTIRLEHDVEGLVLVPEAPAPDPAR